MAIYEAYKKAEDAGKGGKIELREEQKKAVGEALKVFQKPFTEKNPYHKFLWNAKMRFGKTLCAMQLAKEMGVKRTLIVTHRPVVDASWHEDFDKIFEHDPHYKYGNRFDESSEGDFDDLDSFAGKSGNHFVFFVSMQFMRRSHLVNDEGLNNLLKAKIFHTHWDLVVVDEAHEGTLTTLGSRVIDYLSKPETCILHLSGTPFNLYDDFDSGEIFTWDYIKEQKAKAKWNVDNPLLPNPYADLPKMKIFTYDLGTLVKGEGMVNGTFMFSEFFRTWTGNAKKDGAKMPADGKGRFVHEASVRDFLDLLCKEDPKSNYPFSTQDYQENFKHTLWVVPGVAAARAMEKLLKAHETFSCFNIVNVAGATDDEEEDENALRRVLNAIGKDPEQTNTITISCGRLTTGVTVPPWTAVFYMKGSENTNAATYMQTIFRVQTPYHTKDGRMKAECYVFDFAPDRSLKMLAETARFAAKTTGKDKLLASKVADQKELAAMKELLEFCPVIAFDGSEMKKFDDEQALFAKLAEAKIDRVVKKGFDDNALYNVEELLKMDPDAVNQLLKLLGRTPGTKEATKIDLGKAGLTGKGKKGERAGGGGEEGAGEGEDESEDAEVKAAKKAAKKERDNRIAILRGVSLRIPLLIFGAEVTDESVAITVDNFTKVIDDASWLEFMPRNFTKAEFEKIKVCYDRVTFVESGKRYRALAREADDYSIEDRIKAITTIFGYFHNPDKETVLTPWRVVNMHSSDTIGGYCFYNEQFDGPNFKEVGGHAGRVTLPDGRARTPAAPQLVETNEPRFVDQPGVTSAIFQQADENGDTPVKILEINSKTGLYPLYVTYSLYRSILPIWQEVKGEEGVLLLAEEQALWDKILQENIFVICNTPMAARITERTLRGFRKVDGLHIQDIKLVEEATKNQSALVEKLNSKSFWNLKGEGEMKFNAIVGNPPYQENLDSGRSLAKQLFPKFIEICIKINPLYWSLITPQKWFTADGQDNSFPKLRELLRADSHIQVVFSDDGKKLFPRTELGMVSYYLWNSRHVGNVKFVERGSAPSEMLRPLFEDGLDIILPQNKFVAIIKKVVRGKFVSLNTISTGRDAFGINGKGFENRSSASPFKDAVKVQCAYEAMRYVKRSVVAQKGIDILDSYKVFTSKGNGGAGLLTDGKAVSILGKAYVAEPGMACTDSLIPFGKFATKILAANLQKYMGTKFLRFLVGILKVSQNLYQNVYAFVPLQNFGKNSDIDWTKGIAEIDKQLYAKYKLTKDEIAFIESMIKPME